MADTPPPEKITRTSTTRINMDPPKIEERKAKDFIPAIVAGVVCLIAAIATIAMMLTK